MSQQMPKEKKKSSNKQSAPSNLPPPASSTIEVQTSKDEELPQQNFVKERSHI